MQLSHAMYATKIIICAGNTDMMSIPYIAQALKSGEGVVILASCDDIISLSHFLFFSSVSSHAHLRQACTFPPLLLSEIVILANFASDLLKLGVFPRPNIRLLRFWSKL